MKQEEQQEHQKLKPEGALDLPVEEITQYYHDQIAYMNFLGVTEKEYLVDHLKAYLSIFKKEFITNEAKVEFEKHNEMMFDKYQKPLAGFLKMKGLKLDRHP